MNFKSGMFSERIMYIMYFILSYRCDSVDADETPCCVLELGTLHGVRQPTGAGSQKGDKTRVRLYAHGRW